MNKILLFLATGFYTGYLPQAPGTFGSLVGLAVFFYLRPHPLLIILLVIVGTGICHQAEKLFPTKDSPVIVLDEIMGILIAASGHTAYWSSFILFRLLDIFKPYPVNRLQRLPGGVGIMADDIAAGLITNLLISLFLYIVRYLP